MNDEKRESVIKLLRVILRDDCSKEHANEIIQSVIGLLEEEQN